MVGRISGIADNALSAIPVVNQVVPAGNVTSVAAPIAQLADGTTAGVVEVVIPPAAESFPVLEPVLQPVSDLVTGTAPQPVELPELSPVAAEEDATAAAAVVPEAASAAAEPGSDASPAPSESAVPDAPDNVSFPADVISLAATSGPLGAAVSVSDAGDEQPSTADPSPAPTQSPAAPGSGTGSGAASAGSPGSAAFLSSFTFDFPLSGAVCAGETPEHAPAPVSFDPGSSPD
jgi:hypothetical protein